MDTTSQSAPPITTAPTAYPAAPAPPPTNNQPANYFDPAIFSAHVKASHDARHTPQCRNNHLHAALTMAIEVARRYTNTFAHEVTAEQREDILSETSKRYLRAIRFNKITPAPEGNPLAFLDRIAQNEIRRYIAKAKARPI